MERLLARRQVLASRPDLEAIDPARKRLAAERFQRPDRGLGLLSDLIGIDPALLLDQCMPMCRHGQPPFDQWSIDLEVELEAEGMFAETER